MTIAAENRPKPERARAWAVRALAWWLAELSALSRDIMRLLGADERGAVTIEAGERYWTLRHRQRVIGQVDRDSLDTDSARAALAGVVPAALRGRAVTVEIPPERVLSRTVNFPAGARGELDRILEFEIARHFPFPASRVFFRHRIVGRSSGVAPIAVEIVAVPREIVAAICADLAAAGLRASGVALVAGGDAEPLFLPPTALGRGAAARRSFSPVLVAGVAALAVAALATWPLAQQWRLAALDREIAALKPAAEAALQRRNQAQGESERTAALIRARSARPPLVGLLDMLSRQVPDGSWLLSLSIADREIVIDGLSPSAATIALALERSHAFAAIDFRSPITREANGLEHFQLGATIAEIKP